jgi:hypothetical protein
VFLEQPVAEALADSILDAQVEENGAVRFGLANPA